MMKKHILLIEDEEIHAFLIQKAFAQGTKYDCVIHVAHDGEEAMSFLRNRKTPTPVLILMDLRLPKMDGFELLSKLKKSSKFKMIPVIVLSSSDREEDMQKCYELGCGSYIVKPLRYRELREIIHHILNYWIGINRLPTV